jgi:hypothetical protein
MIRRHPIAALWLIATALCAGGALAQVKAPVDEESAKDIVATTVRSLGHPCEQPERAVRDEAASLPGPGRLDSYLQQRPLLGPPRQRRARRDQAARLSADWLSLWPVWASARTSSPRPSAASEMNSTLTGSSSARTRAKVAASRSLAASSRLPPLFAPLR